MCVYPSHLTCAIGRVYGLIRAWQEEMSDRIADVKGSFWIVTAVDIVARITTAESPIVIIARQDVERVPGHDG